MKHWLYLICFAALVGSGCSARRFVVNLAGDALSGTGGTFASDNDPELIRDAVPFGLKVQESLLAESPQHRGLLAGDGERVHAVRVRVHPVGCGSGGDDGCDARQGDERAGAEDVSAGAGVWVARVGGAVPGFWVGVAEGSAGGGRAGETQGRCAVAVLDRGGVGGGNLMSKNNPEDGRQPAAGGGVD